MDAWLEGSSSIDTAVVNKRPVQVEHMCLKVSQYWGPDQVGVGIGILALIDLYVPLNLILMKLAEVGIAAADSGLIDQVGWLVEFKFRVN